MTSLDLVLLEIDCEVDARVQQLLQQQQVMLSLLDTKLQLQLSKIPSTIKTMKMKEYKEKYNEDLETYLKTHKIRPATKTALFTPNGTFIKLF
eukprot:gene4580-7964_t